MNEGAYFHQVTTAIKALYYSGENGNGLLLSGGLAFRSGKSNHFLTGDLHNGVFSNNRYITDKIRGKGFVGGIGYGFQSFHNANCQGGIQSLCIYIAQRYADGYPEARFLIFQNGAH